MSKYVRTSARSGLSDTNVLDIRRMGNDFTDRALAQSFNVHRKTIYDIITNKTWQHVPTPKTVPSFKNYEIYPDGRVWSNKSNKFLSPTKRKTGDVVTLSNGKTKKVVPIATLVARAFLGTRKRKLTLEYVDGDASNSHYTNIVIK